MDPVLVIGSGLAAYTLAREFRKLDRQTPLLLVSRDAADFYSKPMLSNALAGNKTALSLVMKSCDKMAAELNATVLAHSSVDSIDTRAHSITTAQGQTHRYRDLVLALGADATRPPLQGEGAEAVVSVNDLNDYAHFSDALAGAKTVAILGAGLIGCEFANDLLSRGIAPTVVDLAQQPLSRLLPPQASAYLRGRLEAVGVQFRFDVVADRVDRSGAGFAIALSDGAILQADLVLSAIGLRPRVALAQGCGIAVNRGVAVDRMLATSVRNVYAIGDCAEVEGLNLPYVLPLMQQARALAATLCGTPSAVLYPAMPVVVKTPACPTVVCPPAAGAQGQWSVESTAEACEAHYVGSDGTLLGFALLGTATAKRQGLLAQVPALLAAD